jgi:hypothetical protein
MPVGESKTGFLGGLREMGLSVSAWASPSAARTAMAAPAPMRKERRL